MGADLGARFGALGEEPPCEEPPCEEMAATRSLLRILEVPFTPICDAMACSSGMRRDPSAREFWLPPVGAAVSVVSVTKDPSPSGTPDR